ncbi:MAG: SDR family oxidoreductase [Hyphomicrobiales bacterium]
MKNVLVTGASRGIGAGIARVFAREGWNITITSTTGQDSSNIVRELCSFGVEANILSLDVRREDSIMQLFRELDSHGLTLDALVNNAGITGPKTQLIDLSAETLREVCEVNLVGSILCAREAVKRMSNQNGGRGGAIVNISSTGTHLGNPNQWVHYAASKGGIDIFTRGLSREVATDGIRVNAVSPGLTLTDPSLASTIQERLISLGKEIPMARAGSVEEVGEVVEFLCSERASYVTGVVIPVAGGR